MPNTQFDFRKSLGTTDARMLRTHDLQFSLDKRAESWIVSLDFSSPFGTINHQGVGGLVLNIFKDFKINCQQRILVDGNFSQYKSVFFGVPQDSVLGLL